MNTRLLDKLPLPNTLVHVYFQFCHCLVCLQRERTGNPQRLKETSEVRKVQCCRETVKSILFYSIIRGGRNKSCFHIYKYLGQKEEGTEIWEKSKPSPIKRHGNHTLTKNTQHLGASLPTVLTNNPRKINLRDMKESQKRQSKKKGR